MKQIENGLLINEWQLGQQLNTAVHNGTRDKFNLLLSLLSEDARDFAQFSLAAQNESQLEQQKLRDSLFLGEAQPLVNKGMSAQQAASLNNDLHHRNLTSIRLKQLLANEALLSRNETDGMPSDIIDNLSFLSQHRLTEESSKDTHKIDIAEGVGVEMMDLYRSLDLEKKPLKVNYM